jgi:hypothetical protein
MFALGLLAGGLLLGCGSERADLGYLAAALHIPRDVAAELEAVELYVYETDRVTKEPTCDRFMLNRDYYKTRQEQVKGTIAFRTSQETTLDGIPDRGNVWRVYARGLNSPGLLIAHGCHGGVVDVDPDGPPAEITIALERI